jgi:hypothetical protein
MLVVLALRRRSPLIPHNRTGLLTRLDSHIKGIASHKIVSDGKRAVPSPYLRTATTDS